MKTPIADFLEIYSSSGVSRLHMPGHKGKNRTGVEAYDLTEVRGADVLYSADGIIRESEENASHLFGAHTFYSAEGSTLAIRAMLKLAADGRKNGERPLILAGRNAHKSFISTAALLDLDVEWLLPDGTSHIASCHITKDAVDRAITSSKRKISAVYITSPDYLGYISDIKAIADACKKHSVPLLVDNAHGAYLAFLEPSLHPIALGAAMCADSAHKTLPVLTGGAYLHISKDFPEYYERAESALSLFASTSPSYLILRSLDKCNEYLDGEYPKELSDCIERVNKLKCKLRGAGISLLETEPLKITVAASDMGYTGEEISELLRVCGAECEFADGDYTVLMLSPDNTDEDLCRVHTALTRITPRVAEKAQVPPLSREKRVMSIREATFSPAERVSTASAVGRICATPTVACPPAIPIATAGELITEETVGLLQYYGISAIDVVK